MIKTYRKADGQTEDNILTTNYTTLPPIFECTVKCKKMAPRQAFISLSKDHKTTQNAD